MATCGHQCLSMLKRFLHLFAIIGLMALPVLAQRYAFRQYGPEQGLDNQGPIAIQLFSGALGLHWILSNC